MYRLISLFIVSCFIFSNLVAQDSVICTALGQTPSTAFPVCGTNTFSQDSVSPCGGFTIPVPPCPTFIVVNNIKYQINYTDINPYWYKFTCFTTGTLGFTITPNNILDDYDWQLFDITGHDPNEVYTNPSLFFSSNWSGNTGVTGANSTGNSITECGGTDYKPISAMPTVIKKHDYLLLVSHFTSTNQSGYKLAFDGGTASITDTTPPKLLRARAPCDGTIIYIKLNKKMKCGSIALDGSDFKINTNNSQIIHANGVKCDSSFDTDSVLLVLKNPIAPGKYVINIQNGSDSNTIIDNCGNEISPGDSLPVTIYPQFPTPMDTLSIVRCKPTQIILTFNKKIQCSTIASDGSDFFIKGTHPVTVDSAYGDCDEDGFTQTITVRFKIPITLAGRDTIVLKKGNDGNTLINECGKESIAGIYLPFVTYDTVSATITKKVAYSCTVAKVTFSNAINNQKNSWLWKFSDGTMDSIPSFSKNIPIPSFGDKVTLIVSNGACNDTSFQVLNLAYDSLSMNTISSIQCFTKQLIVTFNKGIQCSSIAKDGSNFMITGDHPVPIDSAYCNCNALSGLTQSITLRLKNPITLHGTDTLVLRKGRDGKLLIDSCGVENVSGNYLSFATYDTVSAAFKTIIDYGCTNTTIHCINDSNNYKNSWQWRFSDGTTQSVSKFIRVLPILPILDTLSLKVTNGVCTDSSFQIIRLSIDSLFMDALSVDKCSPKQMEITFKSQVKCSSINPDGSNFMIKGSYPVLIDSAFGSCTLPDSICQSITVRFKRPLSLKGDFIVYMKKGSNGKSLFDACARVSNPNSQLSFSTSDSVSAAFIPAISLQCTIANIKFSNPVNNYKNSWIWQFSDGAKDSVPSFSRSIPITNIEDTIQLKVSNGICVDSTIRVVSLSIDTIKAAFEIPAFYCPNDELIVQNKSTGKINTYLWQYSDGETSTQPFPPNRTFPLFSQEEKDYTLKLTITNTNNCIDSAIQTTRVMRSCFIGVPSVFTPDSREGHRKLYPEGIFKAINFTFLVYNRFGQLVFSSHDYDNQWDGSTNGNPQPTGTYVWMLTYTDALTKEIIFKKGTTVLLR